MLYPVADDEDDLLLDALLDEPDAVSPTVPPATPVPPVHRELRGLQRTPASWLPAARTVPASSVAFMAVALRALAFFAPTSMDIDAVARTTVAFYG